VVGLVGRGRMRLTPWGGRGSTHHAGTGGGNGPVASRFGFGLRGGGWGGLWHAGLWHSELWHAGLWHAGLWLGGLWHSGLFR